MISDYEMPLYNAIRLEFPLSNYCLCYFHLAQSIWRKLQKTGLSTHYMNNTNFNEYIRKILSLCFLPAEKVFDIFTQLKAKKNEFKEINMESFFKYLEDTYFGKIINNIYVYPLYDIKYWSINNFIKLNLPRTINTAESWHRVLNSEMNKKRPNIAYFIRKILEMEIIDNFKILQINGGKLDCPNKDYAKDQKLIYILKSLD